MRRVRVTPSLGSLLLAIWLILTGLIELGVIRGVSGLGTIMAILALAAGVLILISR